ncbi:hypothetical protein FRC03_006427 [Tulasnella sp. 419]|nr:hypothetical protein FRC02_006548 [Tulasnella sp. 418]KAG8968680.1 hypothetical protein FRC03_006427 [Tulasnella sp. 419]
MHSTVQVDVPTGGINWQVATSITEHPFLSLALASIAYVLYRIVDFAVVEPWLNPLKVLPGPPKIGRIFDLTHLRYAMDPMMSHVKQEEFVREYGKNICIQGFGFWDQRLLTFDTKAITYILSHRNDLYPKGWQTRLLLSRLLGEGVGFVEGEQHKRQRKIINPAFAPQVLRSIYPVFHAKAEELRDRWNGLISKENNVLDINHWVGRATFDAFAEAGFDYRLHVIQNEDHELYLAYKKMFDLAVNKGQTIRGFLELYFPWIDWVFPNHITRQVKLSKQIIRQSGEQVIREKRNAILAENSSQFDSEAQPRLQKDILSLLIRSNLSEKQKISEEELLAQINSFFFVGSDSTAMSICWTLYYLSLHPEIQTRLREELLPHAPFSSPQCPDIDTFPFLDAVCKEVLRVCPPVQSTLRVAAQDDIIPTEDGQGVKIRKGQFIHLPMEGLNISKDVWGQDAWEFNPDRWFNLPETAKHQPGVMGGLMTFSIGSHSCPGQKFAVIEMKSFIATLVTSFVFAPVPDKKILKVNVIITRPFVSYEWRKGTQLPMIVTPYVPESTSSAPLSSNTCN